MKKCVFNNNEQANLCHTMKNIIKIGLVIAIQVSLIFTSFVILGQYQSQQKFLGNSVDVAGKNRFLTEKVLLETTDYLTGYHYKQDPLLTLTQLDDNIRVLKDGGIISEKELISLPAGLLPQWELVHSNFVDYKTSVEDIRGNLLKAIPVTDNEFTSIKEKADKLVDVSNTLVSALAKHSKDLSEFIMSLQNVLMLVNISAHILLILIVIRILRNESTKIMKLDRLATIGSLSSTLSHDLRNPLSVIKNTIVIMRRKYENDMDETAKSHFSRIESAVSSIQNQIEDTLNFVRISPLHLESNSLLKILDSVLQTIMIPANIEINLPENDLVIKCDNKKLERVFANLITNSIQVMKNGGKINIRIKDQFDFGLIEIEDTGAGIPNNIMPKIFDPLFTTKQSGTGLGLATCKNIVEQHEGTITVNNNPTIFTVRLPKSPQDKCR
ncbi:MAG: HAMP domain-containing histidine kinase [Thaumarchaeota archaeon]|nr:HAMP domain-containing histidine kinase [Nitrososphaerota archaeon]